MNTYIVLLRGINVGGKNPVSMAGLKQHLEAIGYGGVQTYINSGNVILQSTKTKTEIQSDIQSYLPKWFTLHEEILKVLVMTSAELQLVVQEKPKHFGEEPLRYHSDVIFLIDTPVQKAFEVFTPKEGVDTVWQGSNVIYSQRLSAERTKSRLNKIMSSPLYKSMTIRNWNTVMKLHGLVSRH